MFITFLTTIVKFLFILSGGIFQLHTSFLLSHLEVATALAALTEFLSMQGT